MTAPFISEILTATSAHFGVTPRDLLGHRRSRSIARPRQVAMRVAAYLSGQSLVRIGERFGGRDHSTVHYARAHIDRLIKVDPELAASVRLIGERALELAAARAPASFKTQTEEVEHV